MRAPEPLPILNPSNLSPKTGFQLQKGLSPPKLRNFRKKVERLFHISTGLVLLLIAKCCKCCSTKGQAKPDMFAARDVGGMASRAVLYRWLLAGWLAVYCALFFIFGRAVLFPCSFPIAFPILFFFLLSCSYFPSFLFFSYFK